MRVETIGDATPVWVYALVDPDTSEPRYVGKTAGYMCDRHKAHIRAAKAGSRLPVHSWIRGIMEANKPLMISALELVRDGGWAASERRWIADLRRSGAQLFNVTDGGEGLSGHKFSPEHRQKIANRLRTGSTFTCETCGSEFWRKKNQIARGECRFCSRGCYQASLRGVPRPVPQLCTARGVAAARAKRLSQTHCKRGHMLSGENVFMTSHGARGCKECRRLRKRGLANG